jgi:hypothetical protein
VESGGWQANRTEVEGEALRRIDHSRAARSRLGVQLICSGFLSIGRGEAPVPEVLGAGASGFVDGVGGERVVGDARSD